MSSSRHPAKSKRPSKAQKRADHQAHERRSAVTLPAPIVPLPLPTHPWIFALTAILLVGGGIALLFSFPHATHAALSSRAQSPGDITGQYSALTHQINLLEDSESQHDSQVVSDAVVQGYLSTISLEITAGQYDAASNLIQHLRELVAGWMKQIKPLPTPTPIPVVVPAPIPLPSNGHFIPILYYHKPPADFEQQLMILEYRGYTTIDLAQLTAAITGGGALPRKPVVITFDDGFETQMHAYDLLKKHTMKATFYIINGGLESNWCIGAGRRNGDPSQPPAGCGDAYLTWDQVRLLDASGLITIGGHTLNHRNLASLSLADQRHEIIDSKIELEQQLGHPIHDFAYPYGSYNQTTVDVVHEAGYSDAASTLPGSYQSPANLFTLHRIRDSYNLP